MSSLLRLEHQKKKKKIAHEQAFGRAGNWGEGKAKRALFPLSLPFPRCFFFPKQRACSQANKKNLQIHFEFEYLSFFLPHLELKRY